MTFKDRCVYTGVGDNIRRHEFLNEETGGGETRKRSVLNVNKPVDLPMAAVDHIRSTLPADLIIAGLRTSKTEEKLDRGIKVEVEGKSRLIIESIGAIAERVNNYNYYYLLQFG
jgi:hypothetical protein